MEPQTLTKICKGCNRELPFPSFQRDRQKKDGLCTLCRDCRRTRRNPTIRRAHHQANPYLAWSQRVLQRRRRRGFTIAITPLQLAERAKSVQVCALCSTLFLWDQGQGKRRRPNCNTPCLYAKSPFITLSTIEIICYPCYKILQSQSAQAEPNIQQAPQETHTPSSLATVPNSCGAFSLDPTDYGSRVLRPPSLENT